MSWQATQSRTPEEPKLLFLLLIVLAILDSELQTKCEAFIKTGSFCGRSVTIFFILLRALSYMQDYYTVLGLRNSATADEIRRAYRILARRYHPDVNPGEKSAEKFKAIAEAYRILSDEAKRRNYDADYERSKFDHLSKHFQAYERNRSQSQEQTTARDRYQRMQEQIRRNQAEQVSQQRRTPEQAQSYPDPRDVIKQARTKLSELISKVPKPLRPSARTAKKKSGERTRKHPKNSDSVQVNQLSVIEVSIGMSDAIQGTRRSIEIPEKNSSRKISVYIPPGARTGSVLRLRATNNPAEELVLILKVAKHPYISIENRGLVVEVPITINEAISGASISVPTLDEPMLVRVNPGSQSGHEMRLQGRGILNKDGTRGDLFIRLMIRVPESPDAVGLKDKAKELEMYYGSQIRGKLPKNLLEV